MGKKKTAFGRRAKNLLRLAFLWTRKVGVLRTRLMMDLRLLTSQIKQGLRHNPSPDRIHYGERQLSFDDTPDFQFKMQCPAFMRFRIPCLNAPSVDFDSEDDLNAPPVDFDFADDFLFNENQYDSGRVSFRLSESEEEKFEDCDSGYDGQTSSPAVSCREELEDEEEGGGDVNVRAEKFIAEFKLQRQFSCIRRKKKGKEKN